jgi:hypothetical protein
MGIRCHNARWTSADLAEYLIDVHVFDTMRYLGSCCHI